MSHLLMDNNITNHDNQKVIKFLRTNPKLTNGKKVEEFEHKWSKWLGVKYSVFVNSGSSANLLSVSYLKTIFNSGEIVVPSLTWVSDVTSVIYNNFKPVFVDINLENLAMSLKDIKKAVNKNTKAIFISHILGFNGLTQEILDLAKQKNLFLIEDVCESHGAMFKNKKLGSFGHISNFSFYYAHHMSTIEGGMVCTNDRKIYEIIRMMRSHGMLRESKSKQIKNIFQKKFRNLNKDFIFAYPGYNLRSTEINAIYGLNQLKRLNQNNRKRINNLKIFLDNLDEKKYFTRFELEGSCNYAFVIILSEKNRNLSFRKRFEKKLNSHQIEFRRGTAGGGNQTLQPYLRRSKISFKVIGKLVNTNIVHGYGYYIGNYPDLKKEKIIKICKILNNI